LVANRSGKDLGIFQRNPDTVLPSAMGYALLVGMPIAQNSLSFESRGIQLLLMAPVRFRDVFLAKNLALGLAIFVQAGLVTLMVHFLFGPQQFVIIIATLVAVLFLLLANFSAGNLLSLYFPRAYNFNSFQQRQSPWSIIAGMLVQIVSMGTVYAVYLLSAWWGNRWAAVGALAVLCAAMLQVYLLTLAQCDGLAQQRRETIVTEICRNF
jgi:ABC-2 type transport system permease protein